MLFWSSVATIRRTCAYCQIKLVLVSKIFKALLELRCIRNHLSKLKVMADNILVGHNRVREGEYGHLSFTLATPDLNLGKKR